MGAAEDPLALTKALQSLVHGLANSLGIVSANLETLRFIDEGPTDEGALDHMAGDVSQALQHFGLVRTLLSAASREQVADIESSLAAIGSTLRLVEAQPLSSEAAAIVSDVGTAIARGLAQCESLRQKLAT